MTLEIAILEDDPAQSELIESWLNIEDYQTNSFFNGQSLLDELNSRSFDLLLIDWELPDINGPDVMKVIRSQKQLDTPIIFITSRDSEDDIVNALNSGADDYLVKPVRQLEFIARVKANTKNANKFTNNNKIADDYYPYKFIPGSDVAILNNKTIELSSKEFELSLFLFRNEGKLLERKEILSAVWKQEAELNTRTVDTHVSIIRKKLDISPKNGWRLKSVYGHGYRLEKVNT